MKLRQKLAGLKNGLKKVHQKVSISWDALDEESLCFLFFFCLAVLLLFIVVFIMLFRYHMVDISDSERKYLEFVFEHFML